MTARLKNAIKFSPDKISYDDLTLENYVTTDNLLQNKQGKTNVDKLPAFTGKVTHYRKGDILIANIRPYLKKIWFATEDGGNSADVITLRVKKEHNPKFIYYALLRDSFFDHIMKGSKGTKMPRGDKNQILEYTIPDFDRSKENRIEEILSSLDSKIELNNKINAELEAMAKLIYDYWFVQFDFPISAATAAAMGKPELEGKPYKASGGPMVYNKQLKREIPEGWEDGCLLDIAEFTNGIACQKYRPEEGQDFYRVIKIKEMNDGFTDKSEFVSTTIPEKVIVFNGDILFSWSATLDVKIWSGGIGGLNQHIFKVTSENYPKSYYYFEVLRYLQYFKMVAELRKTTMGHITRDHLKQSRIAIPPKNLANQLHDTINPILEKLVLKNEENQKLSELRDWLLPILMNGQVSIKEAEEELSMAAEPREGYGK